jgi:hypothetical protein
VRALISINVDSQQIQIRYLYGIYLAIDANFRLKRKDVSTEERDPGLGNGLAFFGDVKAYMEHVRRNWDQKQDVRTVRQIPDID